MNIGDAKANKLRTPLILQVSNYLRTVQKYKQLLEKISRFESELNSKYIGANQVKKKIFPFFFS